MQKPEERIVKAERAILPERRVGNELFRPQAVLFGYDANNLIVIGKVYKPKSIHKWAREGTARQDLKTIREEYLDYLRENKE